MFLVVGLGNPGVQYVSNRHNVGFLAIDHLLNTREHKDVTKTSFLGKLFKSNNTLFLKPQTYMNSCGQSISQVCSFFKILPCNLIVVYDDLDMSFGALKFRVGGRDAGHNGLKSINSYIKNEYTKIKVGIGRPEHKTQVNSYVLGDFEQEQLDVLESKIFINIKHCIDEFSNKSFSQISSLYSL